MKCCYKVHYLSPSFVKNTDTDSPVEAKPFSFAIVSPIIFIFIVACAFQAPVVYPVLVPRSNSRYQAPVFCRLSIVIISVYRQPSSPIKYKCEQQHWCRSSYLAIFSRQNENPSSSLRLNKYLRGIGIFRYFSCLFCSRFDRSKMDPVESTPLASTRLRALAQSCSESVFSVESLEKTLIHQPFQQQPFQFGAPDNLSVAFAVSFGQLNCPGAFNLRSQDPQNLQNSASDLAFAALLKLMYQLTAMFASQSASVRAAVNALFDQLKTKSVAFEAQLAANFAVL